MTTTDLKMSEQVFEDGSVMGLACADEHHQRPSAPIDEVMNLAGQPAAGAANTVVRRLDAQICVIRPSPLIRVIGSALAADSMPGSRWWVSTPAPWTLESCTQIVPLLVGRES